MNKPWMLLTASDYATEDGKSKYFVKYYTPSLGFTVDREITEEVYHLLQVAVEVGKCEKQNEIKRVLSL